ncbi:MAG: lysoplasmalogenase family protein [Candidatus Izemoplasmatales bacterium]
MSEMTVFLFVVLLVLAVLAPALFIVLEVKRRHLGALFFKGFASFGFILLAASSLLFRGASPSEGNLLHAALLFAGLVLGLMGDLYLALRPLRPKEENERIILGGTITFALGHLFYLAALFVRYGLNVWVFVAAILLTGAIFAGAKVLRMNWGALRIPSLAYTFVVFLFGVQALFGWIDSGSGADWTLALAVGGILFAVSDVILSQIYFKDKETAPYVVWNLTTYYGAQILIALSLIMMA